MLFAIIWSSVEKSLLYNYFICYTHTHRLTPCNSLVHSLNPLSNSKKKQKKKATRRDWTVDLSICNRMLYHWAIVAPVSHSCAQTISSRILCTGFKSTNCLLQCLNISNEQRTGYMGNFWSLCCGSCEMCGTRRLYSQSSPFCTKGLTCRRYFWRLGFDCRLWSSSQTMSIALWKTTSSISIARDALRSSLKPITQSVTVCVKS